MRVVDQSQPIPSGDHAARTFSAQDVRQGEIILKRPWQRAVFILGTRRRRSARRVLGVRDVWLSFV